MPVALQLLTASDFHAQVGEMFFIHFSEEEIIPAQLDRVLDLPVYGKRERQPFSVLLQTTQKNHYYPQAIYNIEQPALGSLQIFLVPVGGNEMGMQYEAVFS